MHFQLTEREEFIALWRETMVISGIEGLFDVFAYNGNTPEDLNNSVLETLANLAKNERIAIMLLKFDFLDRIVIIIQTKVLLPFDI